MKEIIEERVVSRQSEEKVEEYISLEAEPIEQSDNTAFNLEKLKAGIDPNSEGAKLLESMFKA